MTNIFLNIVYIITVICVIGFTYYFCVSLLIGKRSISAYHRLLAYLLLTVILSLIGSVLIVKITMGFITVEKLAYWAILILVCFLLLTHSELKQLLSEP